MITPLDSSARRRHPWRDPLEIATGLRDQDGTLALLSDGGPLGRWSFVATDPDHVHVGSISNLERLRDPGLERGIVGLIAYDAGARPATGQRPEIWPDLMLARYPAMLMFDHFEAVVWAIGRGADDDAAASALGRAESWMARAVDLTEPLPPSGQFSPEETSAAYIEAVATVVERIAAGDLFQANIARGWTGELRPNAHPFDVLRRLTARKAAYGAYWRIGDRAVVSNSPELFLIFDPDTRAIETRPIKGTRPRHADPVRDARLAEDLLTSAKDRAENLMIVDLMRNDLSRVSEPGSVAVRRLFEVESLPTVHHLVSTVVGQAMPDIAPTDILAATFPPGSITGAPKHQAMKMIAALEPPRGAWCGSLFHIDDDGRMTASVLIRTATFEKHSERWSFRTLAGAGIVADSDPQAELAETEVKILALREALTGCSDNPCRSSDC